MDNNAFWAFFTVAIIAGFAIGMVFTGTGITGQFTQASSTTAVSSASAFGDTDLGMNYEEQGICTGPAGTFQDFCDGPVLLHEFGWNGVKCVEFIVNCGLSTLYKGCEVGRCTNGDVVPTTAVSRITTPVVGTVVPVAPIETTINGEEGTTTGAEPSVECKTASVFSTTTANSVMSSFGALQTSLFGQTGMVFTFAGQQTYVDTSGTKAWLLTTRLNGEPQVEGKTKCFECLNGIFQSAPFGLYCTGGGASSVSNKMFGDYWTLAN